MNLTNGDTTRSLLLLIVRVLSLFCVHNKLLIWIRDFNLHKLGLKCKPCYSSVVPSSALFTAHLAEDADPGVEAVVGGVEGVAAVWAGDAAPPRLLLGVGQDV